MAKHAAGFKKKMAEKNNKHTIAMIAYPIPYS